jgi:hypothetical protein
LPFPVSPRSHERDLLRSRGLDPQTQTARS